MSRTFQAQVVISRREDGSFVVLDALEREHIATDARDLGELLARLVHDPDLPDPVVMGSTQVLIENGLTKIVRGAAPIPDELAVAAGRVGASVGTQAAVAIGDAVKGFWSDMRQRRAEKKRKAEKEKRETKQEAKAPRPVAATKRNGQANGQARKRPSSLRFQEDS